MTVAAYLVLAWFVSFFLFLWVVAPVAEWRYGGRDAVREADGYYALPRRGKRRRTTEQGYRVLRIVNGAGNFFLLSAFSGVGLVWLISKINAGLTPEERHRCALRRREREQGR